MTTKPIKQLDDAMLAEMQRENRNGLSFREIKKICKDVVPFLECYGKEVLEGSPFVHAVLSYIENLENNGLVKVTRRGKFILRIDLTERGKELIKNTIFSDKDERAKH
jgi:predicted methyltransferase